MATFSQGILLLNVVTNNGSGFGTFQQPNILLYTCPAGRFAEITLMVRQRLVPGEATDFNLLINGTVVKEGFVPASIGSNPNKQFEVKFNISSGQTVAILSRNASSPFDFRTAFWHLSAKEFANP